MGLIKNSILKLVNFSSRNQTNIYSKRMTSSNQNKSIKYLSQEEAINLDKELFDEYCFSVDQLMELAGLSVAQAIAKCYPPEKYNKPVICCGPGNNGGDGLVCARHLKLFGYSPIIICPKPARNQLYQNLITQCKRFDIPFQDQVPESLTLLNPDLIIDSIFGFSFKPPNRNLELAKLLNQIHHTTSNANFPIPLASIDIPSGWNVETGYANIEVDQANLETPLKIPVLKPDLLISLTAPKLCAKSFQGKYHYLGGRFCPRSIQEKYSLNLPSYPGTEGVVLLC